MNPTALDILDKNIKSHNERYNDLLNVFFNHADRQVVLAAMREIAELCFYEGIEYMLDEEKVCSKTAYKEKMLKELFPEK